MYNVLIAISCLGLLSLTILVIENARFTKEVKHKFISTYAVIFIALLSECLGYFLNGAPSDTIFIHTVLKALDYIFTPLAGAMFILQVTESSRNSIAILSVLSLNTIIQLISIFTHWTFYVDADNYYHHGSLYFIYYIVFTLTIIFVILKFHKYGKQFSRQNRLSLISIFIMICMAIIFQEFINDEYKVIAFALVMGSMLMFIHYSEFSQITSDENLHYQKLLLETDTLTGLLSRYAYSEYLKSLTNRKSLPDDLVAFAFDVNGLKVTNDTLGHEAGDALITGAASCIKSVFGPYGMCFRTGGDEFVSIVNVDKSLLSGLREKFINETSAWTSAKVESLSVSSGYAASCDNPSLSIEKLVNLADSNMYSDKEEYYRLNSRNRRKTDRK